MKAQSIKKTGEWLIVRWMLMLRPAIITATLGMAIIVLPQEAIDKTPITIVVLGTYLLTLLYWFTHNFWGTSKLLLSIQIAFDVFLVTVIIVIINYTTGSYDPSFTGLYFLSIMCASLFFKRFVTFLFSIQSIFFFISSLFIIGPYLNPFFISDDMKNSVILQAFIYSALMLAVGFFSSYYAEKVIKKDTALTSALRLLKKAKLDTSDILQSMTNGLIIINSSGSIMYMNRAAKMILQIDDNVVEGKNFKTILEKKSPEFVGILERGIHEHILPSEKEIEVYNKKGDSVPIGLTMVTLYDIDGSSRGVIVNFKDLTEKNKLLAMIRQSDRMAAIGELSAAIAHEIKNPLASICSAVEILVDSFDTEDPQISKLLNIINRESERLERISSDFLKFTRINAPDIKTLELKSLIEGVLELIENDPRKTDGIIIRNKINKETFVLFDEDQLKQIIINLLINSLEALDGKGDVELALEGSVSQKNKYIRLHVRDNGPGFPEEALGKMFEPFYSTKKGGTGLGLAIVRKMAISNNGRVFAQNHVDGGAEVALDILVEVTE